LCVPKTLADGVHRGGEAAERESPTDGEVVRSPRGHEGVTSILAKAECCAAWRATLSAIPKVLVPMLENVSEHLHRVGDVGRKDSETVFGGSLQ
jgi:hypothetical protein